MKHTEFTAKLKERLDMAAYQSFVIRSPLTIHADERETATYVQNPHNSLISLSEWYDKLTLMTEKTKDKDKSAQSSRKALNTVIDEVYSRLCKDLIQYELDSDHKLIPIFSLTNTNQIYMENLISRPFFDMSVIYAYRVATGPFTYCEVPVTEEILELTGDTEEYLYQQAEINTPQYYPAVIQREEEFATERFIDYRFTNNDQLVGGRSVLYPNVLSDFAEEKQTDLGIIPTFDESFELYFEQDLVRIKHAIEWTFTKMKDDPTAVYRLSRYPLYYDRKSKTLSIYTSQENNNPKKKYDFFNSRPYQ